MENHYRTVTTCRICRSTALYDFLNLGTVPPVNSFRDSPDDEQTAYPLEVTICEDCNHVQLKNTVRRDLLFEDYSYFSSASEPIVEHFGDYAGTVEDQFLSTDDLVLEIGCNDGVMLHQFSDAIPTVGVEPAENVANVARSEYGLDVVIEFFGPEVAKDVRNEYGSAKAIVANNVLGHIDDLHGVMRGIETLLGDDGVLVVEVPYLVDLLNNVEFDTIYHEHISYFALQPLVKLFDLFGMEIFNIDRFGVHGGTIRVFAQRAACQRAVSDYVEDLFKLEATLGLDSLETYDEFSRQVRLRGRQLRELLNDFTERGHSIVGYGASAKGNVLLNYCDIGPETIEYIVDTTPAKQGTYSPGMHIPVREPKAFSEQYPDVAVLLAWNYRESILEKEQAFRDNGGRFLIPMPYVDIT